MSHEKSSASTCSAPIGATNGATSNAATPPPVRAGRWKPLGDGQFEARDVHGHCVFVLDAQRGVLQTKCKGVLSEFVLSETGV